MTPPERYWRSICSSENGTTDPCSTHGPSSTTITSSPASARTAAVVAPPAPEPMIRTSQSCLTGSGHVAAPELVVAGHVSHTNA